MSASNLAYEHIRRKILQREFTPGEKMTYRELAAELAVSRIPISEAIRRLEHDGLVVCTPRGVFVNNLTIREVEEVSDVREFLEGLSCRLFVTIATAADIELLRTYSDEFDRQLSKGQFEPAQVANVRFHSHIAKRCPNSYLSQLIDNSLLRMRTISVATLWDRKEEWQVERWRHGSVLDAIISKDGTQAEMTMREHIRWGKEDIVGAMVKAGHR